MNTPHRLRLALLPFIICGAAHAQAERSPREVARRFYDAFCAGDAATLEQLYHPQVKFKDEIFRFQDRAGVMGMWRLLTAKEAGAKFTYELLGVEGEVATVRWKADYKFPPPDGNPVHNVITARLVVKDGLIVEHTDSFSWHRWSSQAFGLGPWVAWVTSVPGVKSLIKAVIRGTLAHQVAQAGKKATAGITERLGGS